MMYRVCLLVFSFRDVFYVLFKLRLIIYFRTVFFCCYGYVVFLYVWRCGIIVVLCVSVLDDVCYFYKLIILNFASFGF